MYNSKAQAVKSDPIDFIFLQYENFQVVGWEIDPTFNVTPQADIWTNKIWTNTNISYFNGDWASASVGVTNADWTTKEVPEPGVLFLFAAGLIGLAGARKIRSE